MGLSLRQIRIKLVMRFGSEESVNRVLRSLGMRIGEDTRIYTLRLPGEPWLVRIGNRCEVAPDVTFITHGASTVFKRKYNSLTSFGKIDIRDDTYIGVNATVMPDVTIGPNAIVGACSVVTKDVPPNTVVGGNPARPICTLEEYEQRCVEGHIDVPRDRAGLQRVLERHFWGDEA